MAAFKFWCVSGLSSLVSLCTNLVQSLGLKVKASFRAIRGYQGYIRAYSGLLKRIDAQESGGGR